MFEGVTSTVTSPSPAPPEPKLPMAKQIEHLFALDHYRQQDLLAAFGNEQAFVRQSANISLHHCCTDDHNRCS